MNYNQHSDLVNGIVIWCWITDPGEDTFSLTMVIVSNLENTHKSNSNQKILGSFSAARLSQLNRLKKTFLQQHWYRKGEKILNWNMDEANHFSL